MWPTFYFGGAILRPELSAHACAVGTATPNLSLAVPMPSGVKAGHLLIAHAHANALGGSSTLTRPTGWIEFARLDRNDDGNFGTLGPVAWKIANATDEADAGSGTRTFTFNNTTQLRQQICITAFANVDTNQPFGAMNIGRANATIPGNGSQCVNLPVIYPTDPFGGLLGFMCGNSSLGADLYETANPVDNGGDYQASYENVDDDGSVKSGNLLALWLPTDSTEGENLVPYHYRQFNSWTKINATVNDSFVSGDARFSELTFNSTAGAERKAIYREVNLTAGQTYTFIVFGYRSTTTAGHRIWLSVDDGTTERGCYFQPDKKESTFGSPDAAYVFEGHGGGTAHPDYYCLVVTPTVTGTHKLWIGASNALAQTTTSALTPLLVIYAQLIQRHCGPYLPRADLVKNPSTAAITGKIGYAGRLVQGIEVNNALAAFSIELRRNSGAYSPMRVDPLYYNPCYLANEAGTGPAAMLFKTTYPSMFRATAPVFGTAWTNTGTGKYYAEITWTTRQSAAGDIGFGTQDMRTTSILNGAPVAVSGGEPRTEGYYGDGKVYEGGNLKGTYTTWGVGDVMGIAVDFNANTCTFYKNGTSIVTITTFVGDYPRWFWVENGGTSAANTDTFTANLTGPFSYKPTGYQAWDWNNDLS